MIRLFNIAIQYQGTYLLARVAEFRHSPTTYFVTFRDHWNIEVPEEVILNTKKGKLGLADNSSPIDATMLKLVIQKIEEHLPLFQ